MKKLFLFLFLVLSLSAMSAKKYWIGGGSNANWNATPNTNWSATSGGIGRVAAPGATDSVYFDGAGATGNSNSTISVNIVVLMFTVSPGYTKNIYHNAYLSVSGDITLHSGYTITGNVALQSTGSGIITTGGKVLNIPFNFITNNGARTLNGDLVCDRQITLAVSGLVINSSSNETITANAGLSVLSPTAVSSTKIILTGGQWGTGTGGVLNMDLDLQGNITVYSGGMSFGSRTLTYVSGTLTLNNVTLYLSGTPTLNTAGITWPNILLNTTISSVTLTSTLTVTNMTTSVGTSTLSFLGNYGFVVTNLTVENYQAFQFMLQSGTNYIVSSILSAYKSRVLAIVLFTSNHASDKAMLTLNDGAVCNCVASFTRIDASAGRTISTFNGTITDCINIIECHDCFGSTIGG